MAISPTGEMDSRLVRMCIEAATQSVDSVEKWRRQRRTLERMPSQLAEALLHSLLRRRLLFPSLLEIFKYCVEEIDLGGENSVDTEWMAYLGAFHRLRSLNIADCHKINSSALWAVAGMTNLKELDVSRCSKFTDAGIRHLLSIPTLEKLCISETGVSAEGVTLLSSLASLSVLDLGGLPVTDLALRSLQVLTELQYLDLWGSEISNKGASLLKVFPKLNFLNLAWTKVTNLPNLPSLTCLNMSNCTMHTIFEGVGEKAHLEKLIFAGTTFLNVSEAFIYIQPTFLSYLDLSNSPIDSFSFLHYMGVLKHLDLSNTSLDDELVGQIACIGANLIFLNLSKTRVSSAGVKILSGQVPNLETILLSGTSVDDLAILYISMMRSLKVIDLSGTNVKGLIHQEATEPEWVPSLAVLKNLCSLERLNLEETHIRDVALRPLSQLQSLTYLSVGSGSLTDMSLYHLSLINKLINLSVRDAVLTDTALISFKPPETLEMLDLMGCWLLTEDVLSLFCQRYPRIDVKHELVHHPVAYRSGSNYSSPSSISSRKKALHSKDKGKQLLPHLENNIFLDQRLKYSREELLALQFSSASLVPSSNPERRV